MPRFTKLTVYHQARDVLRLVVARTESFAGWAGLKDQMRRAAVSIVSNICEGAEHGSDRELRRFLTIAKASAGELVGQIAIAEDLLLIDAAQSALIGDLLARLCGGLGKFIRRLEGG